MVKKPHIFVYLAGPYSLPDPDGNVLRHEEYFAEIQERGFVVVPPVIITHEVHKRFPRSYETWMTIDFAWLSRCDWLFRMPGDSPGADREVQYAIDHKKPVFTDISEMTREAYKTKW